VNDKSESCFGCDVGHHGRDACSPGCDCARRPPTAEDLPVWEAARAGIAAGDGHAQAARVARQARLARGQWTDAGAGLQVRLA
jgi:hypothetical protein